MEKVGENSYAPFRKGVIGEKLGKGSHSVVRDLNPQVSGKNYVVKIGQTEKWQPPLFHQLKFNIPRKLASRLIVRLFNEPGLDFYPTVMSIKRAFQEEYGLINRYFGSKSEKARKELSEAMADPGNIFYQKMMNILGGEERFGPVREAFKKHLNDNFLKDESVVIGLSPDIPREKVDQIKLLGERKDIPVTYYIVQEKVEGERILPVSVLKDEDLKQRPDLTERLLMFCLLQRKMYQDTSKIIDTRPEELGKHPMEWFQQTANILVDMETNQPYFIDTRFLGNRKTRFMGFLVDVLSRRSVDRAIKKYAKILAVSKI